MRKQRSHVTEKTFNAVKIMLAGGATCVEVAEYLQIGKTAVYRMKTAQDWNEYRNMLAAMAIKQREKKEEKKVDKPVVEQQKTEQTKPEQPLATNYQINRMVEEMKIMNEHLKLISNKIAFIVDQLV